MHVIYCTIYISAFKHSYNIVQSVTRLTIDYLHIFGFLLFQAFAVLYGELDWARCMLGNNRHPTGHSVTKIAS